MCSNSLLSALKRSGASHWVGLSGLNVVCDVLLHVVSMWCVMSCFTGVSGEETLVRVGNSDSRVR